jgi:hypothetical protein
MSFMRTRLPMICFNQVKDIKTAIVVYVHGKPAAIGCFKKFNDDTVKLKRCLLRKNSGDGDYRSMF